MRRKAKAPPAFRTEAEERRFWEANDSTAYVDWSKAERARFPNLKPSTTAISLRLPVGLLERIKVAANKRDMPYQSLIKAWLAEKADRAEGVSDAASHEIRSDRGCVGRPARSARACASAARNDQVLQT